MCIRDRCKNHCNVRVFAECQPIIKTSDIGDSESGVNGKEYEVDYCTAQDLHTAINSDTGEAVVFDVREKTEYRRLHIPGATCLPITYLMKGIEELAKDSYVYLVCSSGRRSFRSAHMMKTLGYKKVKVLGGGLLGWEASGYKIVFESESFD